ncbi:hypothetical protein D3C73_1312800 [compost metagenome]
MPLDLGQALRAIAVGSGQQHRCQGRAVDVGRRLEQKVDGRARVMHAVFQAQGEAAVLLYRQVITGRGEIQGARLDGGLVTCLFDTHGHPTGEHLGQLAAPLVRQVQDNDDR